MIQLAKELLTKKNKIACNATTNAAHMANLMTNKLPRPGMETYTQLIDATVAGKNPDIAATMATYEMAMDQ